MGEISEPTFRLIIYLYLPNTCFFISDMLRRFKTRAFHGRLGPKIEAIFRTVWAPVKLRTHSSSWSRRRKSSSRKTKGKNGSTLLERTVLVASISVITKQDLLKIEAIGETLYATWAVRCQNAGSNLRRQLHQVESVKVKIRGGVSEMHESIFRARFT